MRLFLAHSQSFQLYLMTYVERQKFYAEEGDTLRLPMLDVNKLLRCVAYLTSSSCCTLPALWLVPYLRRKFAPWSPGCLAARIESRVQGSMGKPRLTTFSIVPLLKVIDHNYLRKIYKTTAFPCRTLRIVLLLKVNDHNYLRKISKTTVFSCRTVRIVLLLEGIDYNYLGKICKIMLFFCKKLNDIFCKFKVFAHYLNYGFLL